MKILQINNCHYRRGGADVVYLNTGQLLEKHGHQVIYFSTKSLSNIGNKFEPFFVDGIDYFNDSLINRISKVPRFFYSLQSKQKISFLINEYKPDLAHVHLYKGYLTPSVLVALKEFQIPTVITVHDYGLLCPHNLFLDGKNNICEKCLTASKLNCVINKCNRNSFFLSSISVFEYLFHNYLIPFDKHFNKIILVSKFAYEKHSSVKNIKSLICHLYNFYPDLKNTKVNDTKGDYLLYYGRLSKEKGIIRLIEAWMSKSRKAKLKIVGTGPLYSDIIRIINENKITNIEILGFKQGEELFDIIKKSSFVVVPSEWYENNPLTIIESYANGKPVIGSRVGGIPEIIQEEKTGFIFEMGNITELSEKITMVENMSDMTYKKFSVSSRNFAERYFSEQVHYPELIKIYNSVVGGNNQ
jgi:glycosyltransferase involved in cell wall biosynthesis